MISANDLQEMMLLIYRYISIYATEFVSSNNGVHQLLCIVNRCLVWSEILDTMVAEYLKTGNIQDLAPLQ
jgi:hypothetical protein